MLDDFMSANIRSLLISVSAFEKNVAMVLRGSGLVRRFWVITTTRWLPFVHALLFTIDNFGIVQN